MVETATRTAALELAAAMTALYNSEGPMALVRRYDEFFTPGFRWHGAMATKVEGEVFEGRDGFARWAEGLGETFRDLSRDDQGMLAVGDGVLILGRLIGLGRGSGVPFDQEIGFFFRFREGRCYWARAWLSHVDALADTAEILRSPDA